MEFVLLIFFISSAFIYFFYNINALIALKKQSDRKMVYLLSCTGTAVSAWLFFIPYYLKMFGDSFSTGLFKSVFLAAHHAIRLFVVDAGFDEIQKFAADFGILGDLYSIFGIFLLLTAPLLTFGAIASLLRELSMHFYVQFNFKKDQYIFSEINLQSLYLAHDIARKNPHASIVFMEKKKGDKDEIDSVKRSIRAFHPTFLPGSMVKLAFMMSRRGRDARYFIIGDDELENAAATIALLELPTPRSRREIYVKLGMEDHLLDDLPGCENTEVYRVEHIYSTVINDLEKLGTSLFEGACETVGGEKVISALVVGLGEYGCEMIKNLAWYTQVEGYRTQIHAFDMDDGARERLEHLCPGFFAEDRADRHLDVTVHSGSVFGRSSFDRELEEIGDVGYVFVAFGDDNANVNAAYGIRTLFARLGKYPIIQTVVRHGEISRVLSKSKTCRGESYDIDFIGSYEEIYSVGSIIDSQTKEDVMNEQLKWSDEKSARAHLSHEEQYRLARANNMHSKLLMRLGVPEELHERSQHRSWVNFMFSEGYRYGPVRDNIAKLRPNLVSFDDLMNE